MEANYEDYKNLVNDLYLDNLSHGYVLSDQRLNDATEKIRQYLVQNGAGQLLSNLGIGIKLVTKSAVLLPDEIVSRNFVWTSGPRQGNVLSVDEIYGIGMFLKGGAFFQKITA